MPSMNISVQLQILSATMLPGAVAARRLQDLCSCCGLLTLSRVWAKADNSLETHSLSVARTCGQRVPVYCELKFAWTLQWGQARWAFTEAFIQYSVLVSSCLACCLLLPVWGVQSLPFWQLEKLFTLPISWGLMGQMCPHPLSSVPIAWWTSLPSPHLELALLVCWL